MKFRVWKHWVNSLPWSLRWFVLLILFRPFLDIFYFLKEVSPFVSPLYIVGLLTPVLILSSFLARTFPRRRDSLLDVPFAAWGSMLVCNFILVLTLEYSIHALETALKLITPVLVFFYLRHLVRSQRDLMGVLTTFLYSTVVPFGMLLYERLVEPVSSLVYTRGFGRYEGLYADVVSYAIYIIGALLISCYFFLNADSAVPLKKRALLLTVVGSLTVLGLLSMHHTTSWGVAAAVVGLLLLYSIGKQQISTLTFVLLLGIVGYFFVGNTIGERLSTALQTDIAVIEGKKDVNRSFHGRMSRWKRYVAYWDDEPLLDKLLGTAWTATDLDSSMLGKGFQNDYLRNIFVAGLLGFCAYLLAYLVLFVRSIKMANQDKFLVQGGMAVILLYSITTTPTLYAPLLYLVFSIFAYAALPQPVRLRVPVWRVKPHRREMLQRVVKPQG